MYFYDYFCYAIAFVVVIISIIITITITDEFCDFLAPPSLLIVLQLLSFFTTIDMNLLFISSSLALTLSVSMHSIPVLSWARPCGLHCVACMIGRVWFTVRVKDGLKP